METIMNGTLAGFALGGLTVAVVEINTTVVQTLWRFNCLAAKTYCGMAKLAVEWITQTEDDDDDDDDDDDEPNES